MDDYDKMIEENKQKETDLLDEIKSHSEADEAFVISCSYILELAKRAAELFTRSQPEQKNKLLRFVFSNCSVKGEKLDYKLKKPFAGIVQSNKSKNWLWSLYDVRQEVTATCKRLEAAFGLLREPVYT